MVTTAQWIYTQREPLSWLMGVLVGFAVMWGLSDGTNKTNPMRLTEMTAMLDMSMPRPESIPTPTPQSRPQALPQQTTAPMAQSAPTVATQIAAAPSSTAPTETPVRSVENKPSLPLPPVAAPVLSPLRQCPSSQQALGCGRIRSTTARLPRTHQTLPHQPRSSAEPASGCRQVVARHIAKRALVAVGLLNSSGSNILDSEALRTVRTAQFPPFSDQVFPNEASHRFSVSLKYQIEGQ